MCDDGYYDSGGYTDDFVHHDVVHHDVVTHHDYVHHDYCAPHVDFITPGIGIGVGMGVGYGGYGYGAPGVNVITPVPAYGPTVMTSYPSPAPVGYVQDVHVVPPGPVIYRREPEVSCCAYCSIL